MAANTLQYRALQLLEFDRVAYRHPNHRFITTRDLVIAHNILLQSGETFPSDRFIRVLEFVDGPISEQALRALLLQLRASVVSSDFRYHPPTVEEAPEDTPQPEPEPEPEVKEEGSTTETPKAARSSNGARWLHRLIFVVSTTLFVWALGAKVKYLHWHGLEQSIIPPTQQSYGTPVLFSTGAASPSPPTPPPSPNPLAFPSPASEPILKTSTSTTSTVQCSELRKMSMSSADVERVVEAAKRCTLATVPDLRAFHNRFRLFIMGVPPAEVAACVRRQPFVTDMPDFSSIFRSSSDDEKDAFRLCVAELKEAVEAGVPMASASPDVPKSYIDWERVVSCLAWTTCDKLDEWDQTLLPVKDIWSDEEILSTLSVEDSDPNSDDDFLESEMMDDDEEVQPAPYYGEVVYGDDADVLTPYEVEMPRSDE